MRTAERELTARPEFSHVVVNDRLEDATEQLTDIVRGVLAGGDQRDANLGDPDEQGHTL
jgi:guanylate kinase